MIYQKEIYYDNDKYDLINISAIDCDENMINDVISSVWFINFSYYLKKCDIEKMFVIGYNESGSANSVYHLSIGTQTETPYYNKNLALYALLSHAAGFRIFHNHPNGVLAASDGDFRVLNEVGKTLSLFDLKFLGSIIITKDGFLEIGQSPCFYDDYEIFNY